MGTRHTGDAQTNSEGKTSIHIKMASKKTWQWWRSGGLQSKFQDLQSKPEQPFLEKLKKLR